VDKENKKAAKILPFKPKSKKENLGKFNKDRVEKNEPNFKRFFFSSVILLLVLAMVLTMVYLP